MHDYSSSVGLMLSDFVRGSNKITKPSLHVIRNGPLKYFILKGLGGGILMGFEYFFSHLLYS